MNTAWTAASEEMYKATQEAGANGNGGGQANGGQQPHEEATANANDNVTDAEFEEVK
jgi:molecular chaperone DnaK